MQVIYDAQAMEEEKFSVKGTDRAFRYGDGLFETMIYEEGKVPLLGRHWRRLTSGMKVLKMERGDLSEENILRQILTLIDLNHIRGSARVRLQVWRKEGGLYTPGQQQAHFLLTATPFERGSGKVIQNAGISKEVFLYQSSTSRFKTCNALSYILAGIEKKERNLDDLVLLDHQGNISECSSANIFWVKEGLYFTPSLETGCIEGVMRGHLMDGLKKAGKEVRLVKETKESLFESDSVFICNVTGVFPVKRIEDQYFDTHLNHLPDSHDTL